MKKKMLLACLFMLFAIVMSACSFPSRQADQATPDTSAESSQVENANEAEEDTASVAGEAESEDAGSANAESEPAEPQEHATSDDFATGAMENRLNQFVLRDEDLPHDYRLPPGGEYLISTKTLINEMKELPAKRYVLETGRISGWGIKLERVNKEDFAPTGMESRIELFESSQGAALAISPEWHPAYQGDVEISWVDGGCAIGDECLFYYIETYDAASQITKLRYEVAFAYRNVLVWVMGHGLDVDVTPEYILNAAQTIYEKLDLYAQSQ